MTPTFARAVEKAAWLLVAVVFSMLAARISGKI